MASLDAALELNRLPWRSRRKSLMMNGFVPQRVFANLDSV
jgi:hypothetical protein